MLFLNKKKISGLLAVIMAAVSYSIPLSTYAADDNLIKNPGFEEGNHDGDCVYNWFGHLGWIGNSAWSGKGLGVPIVDGGHSGAYCASWGSWGVRQLAQHVNVEKNTNYELKFWYKTNVDGRNPKVELSVVDGVYLVDTTLDEGTRMNTPSTELLKPEIINAPDEWTEVERTFNSGDCDTIVIKLMNVENEDKLVLFDDFSLYSVGAPVAENVRMSGYPSVGQKLKLYADTRDDFGGVMQESEYKWQISDDGSAWSDIADAAEREFVIDESHKGKYIRGGVVPVAAKADGSSARKGAPTYSSGVQILAATSYDPQELNVSGTFIGTSEEAAEIADIDKTIDGYILGTSGLTIENNAIMHGEIAYSVDLNSADRALKIGSDDTTVSLQELNAKKVNVLMTYTQAFGEATNKVVLNYTDGTSEEMTYTPGMLSSLTDGADNVNSAPLGLYATAAIPGESDKNDEGYIYSYTFDANMSKTIKSITFCGTGSDSILLLAITLQESSKDDIKLMAENAIAELKDFKYEDKQKITDALALVEKYVEFGGSEDEISGIAELNALKPYVDFSVEKLDEADSNTTFKKIYESIMSDRGRDTVDSLMKSKVCGSYDSFVKEYKIQIILKVIQYPATGGTAYVQDIVTSGNAAAVGLSVSEYLAASDKTSSNDAVAKKQFDTLADLAAAIKPSSSGSGGGSGSGSGSSSGSSKKGSSGGTIYSVPSTKEEVKEEQEYSKFADISEDYWLFKELYQLKELGIVSGDDNGNFNPTNSITREEFVKLVCVAFKISPKSGESEFSDVKYGSWYAPYVNAAVDAGVVNGMGENIFGVGQTITRQDVCTMLYRMIKKDDVDIQRPVFKFADREDIAIYAIEAVEVMQMAELINGYEDNTFRPRAECTREQAIKMLYNILKSTGRLNSDNV